jgi:NTP pyrophosphatase (non-canonical NTP hydrolase)
VKLESAWQQKVADFARRHSILHDPVVHALDLASEVGEVAKEILLATDYGRRAVPPRPQLGDESSDALSDELGDALYSLLALAEACGVDAGAALHAALEKYERRFAERGKAGSR